jgi:hypothetical protein
VLGTQSGTQANDIIFDILNVELLPNVAQQ